MQLGDFTCIAQEPGAGRTPVPMFSYTTSEGYADLVLPDFTYYGHEYDYLMDPWGNPAHGWPAQASVLLTKYANVSLASRLPQAMWRGRTMDSNYPHRDALRRAFLDCVRALRASGREDDAALLNVDREPIVMQDFDDYRYQVHIEPLAWVSNIRHKLAGGSVVMATGIKYYEWFARALVPGTHYVEIPARVPEMCAQAVDVVRGLVVGRRRVCGRGGGARNLFPQGANVQAQVADIQAHSACVRPVVCARRVLSPGVGWRAVCSSTPSSTCASSCPTGTSARQHPGF